MNLVRHMNSSPGKAGKFARHSRQVQDLQLRSDICSVVTMGMLLRCCSPHLSRESVSPRRRPPFLVCQSCAQTVSGFCSTGRRQVSESCWTKSGGLCWRSPNIPHLCPGTSGGVIGGSRSHYRSICRQWWSRPASGNVNQMSPFVLTRCRVNAWQKKEAYWVA